MFSTYLRLIRDNRNYRLLWIAQVVSELGDWFYALAVYNLLLELTGGKAQAVALAVVLQVLPQVFAAPTAGVVNDRISRRAIMIGADVARLFVVLGMLGVRTPGMVCKRSHAAIRPCSSMRRRISSSSLWMRLSKNRS